ncbi:hypothetical protein B0H12DRAFT_1172276 [Mycena haematopus]|nr:hypothetical protein B0H12DRAFT_1172276 [Mycena haematopus]
MENEGEKKRARELSLDTNARLFILYKGGWRLCGFVLLCSSYLWRSPYMVQSLPYMVGGHLRGKAHACFTSRWRAAETAARMAPTSKSPARPIASLRARRVAWSRRRRVVVDALPSTASWRRGWPFIGVEESCIYRPSVSVARPSCSSSRS